MDFKEQLQQFKETTANYQCDGLIIPGTGQAETAALLIHALRPQRIALILTSQTIQFKQSIKNLLSNSAHYLDQSVEEFGIITDVDDTQQIYRLLRDIFDKWPTNGKYIVDVTGGTKPMTVGLAKAASLLDWPTIYVASKRNNNVVIPGSQNFVVLPDPYVVFGDLEAEEARRLANNHHDYGNANRIFANLTKREQMPGDLREYFHSLMILTKTYADWDVFNLNGAYQQIIELVTLINDRKPINLYKYKDILQRQAKSLELLSNANAENNPPFNTLQKELPTVLALLGSLYANAIRREKQGRYDFAAFLLYRCLELISQRRLAQYGINSQEPKYDQAKKIKPDLEERYKQTLRSQGRKPSDKFKLPKHSIGLFAGYMFLKTLEDDLLNNYEISRIEDRTEVRNRSILAHGLRLIGFDEYNQFKEVVDELLERFFLIEGQKLEEWKNDFTFIELDKVNL